MTIILFKLVLPENLSEKNFSEKEFIFPRKAGS